MEQSESKLPSIPINWNDKNHSNFHQNILLKDYKLCIMVFPKSANTSFKWALADALNIKVEKGKIHNKWHLIEPCTIPDDYDVIAIVRNPIERVKSLYADKLIGSGGPGGQLAKNGFERKMSIDKYINRLCDLEDKEIDQHLRSQTYSMYCNGKFLPNKIFKIEDGWTNVINYLKQYDINIETIEQKNVSKKDKKEKIDNELSDKHLKLLYRRYKEDLKILGYQ